jgi:hypothetical protein
MIKPFIFTHEDLKRFEAQAEENQKDIDFYRAQKWKALGSQLRLHLIKPFCQKFDLTFDTSMGQWSFCYTRNGKRKCWFVGEDRCELPGRPDNEDGDEWWAEEITEEEKLIKVLLNQSTETGCLGTWIEDYPNKQGL